jgi:multisubunit Na+/H+ antiporter MnhG subunit
MAGPHENLEHAEHVEHAAHSNKKIALLIAVIALFLAFSETLGKSAQTKGLIDTILASDTWAFYQAKGMRQTTLRVAADAMTIEGAVSADAVIKAAALKQIETWRRTADRYESEPRTKEGKKELMARAKAAEKDRDVALARYHNYEFSSAAYQIGIVLASASVITGMILLAYVSAGLGVIGLIFTGLGLFAPNMPHDVLHWFERLLSFGGAH